MGWFCPQKSHELLPEVWLELSPSVCCDGWRDTKPGMTKTQTTVSSVMSGMGMASVQRVNWSIQVRRYISMPFCRWEWPNSVYVNPVKSAVWSWEGRVWCSRVMLNFWHGRHDRANLLTSALILGQTYLAVRLCCVARMPGWDNEWRESNTVVWSQLAWTKGQGTPVDTSHMIVPSAIVRGIASMSEEGDDDCNWWVLGHLVEIWPLLESQLQGVSSGAKH